MEENIIRTEGSEEKSDVLFSRVFIKVMRIFVKFETETKTETTGLLASYFDRILYLYMRTFSLLLSCPTYDGVYCFCMKTTKLSRPNLREDIMKSE